MSVIQVKIILAGHYAGKTVKLNKFQFVDGQIILQGPQPDVDAEARFIEINWQGLREGDPRLKELANVKRGVQAKGSEPKGPADVSGSGEPEGSGSDPKASTGSGDAAGGEAGSPGGLPAGDGHEEKLTGGEPAHEPNLKLRRAVMALDANNDAHWTKDGKPAMSAVGEMYGSQGFTRQDVDASTEGYTRAKARGEAT